jgi:putative tricarboxylic transport membrane protein
LKEHVRDLATGILFLVFSIVYFIFTWNIRAFSGDGATPITAKTMPQIWAVLAMLCAVCLIVRSLSRMKKAKAEGETREKPMSVGEWLKHNYAVVGTFVMLAVYAAALKPVGYVVSTMVYLLIQIPLLTQKEKLKQPRTYVITLILTVVFTILTDYMFVRLFSVRLPKGLIGF